MRSAKIFIKIAIGTFDPVQNFVHDFRAIQIEQFENRRSIQDRRVTDPTIIVHHTLSEYQKPIL